MARQKGKYEHLVKTMRRLPGVSGDANADPRYQDRVDEAKRAILAPPQPDEEVAMHGRENLAFARNAMGVINQNLALNSTLLLRSCAGKRHAIEFGHAYAAARDMAAEIKARLSEANLLVEAFGQLLAEQAENEDTRGMDVGGRALSIWQEPWTKVVDKNALRAFFQADPDLAPSLAPAWATVDALNRQRLLAGADLLPGTEAWAKQKIRLGGE